MSNDSMSNFTRRFPLLVAMGALMVYGVTLSHGMTMNSLSLTAKVAGWDWTPMVGQPLLWLLTLPLRWLPAAWVPPGLNFFSAATAALTLGLLARTVQLLPWDRPWENTNRLAGTLPVLLACAVCGLEFSFWQEATAATGEMLDLLLPAAALVAAAGISRPGRISLARCGHLRLGAGYGGKLVATAGAAAVCCRSDLAAS